MQRSCPGIYPSGVRALLLVLPILFVLPIEAQSGSLLLPDSTGSGGGSTVTGHRPLDTLVVDFEAFFVDAWDLLQVPGRWNRTDWIRAGILVGGTSAVFAADRSLHREVIGWQGSDGDNLVDAVDYMGHNSVGLISAGLLYLPGLILDLPWLRLAGRHLAQTLVYSAGLGSLLKGGLGRGRPFNGEGPYRFRGPWQNDNAWMSLPSGHTIVAFSIASTLSATIDRPWATALLYGAATLTAVGRVYQNQHWGSDVLFAAVLTSAIGHGVVSLGEGDDRSDDMSVTTQTESPRIHFSLSPAPDGLRTGFSVTW